MSAITLLPALKLKCKGGAPSSNQNRCSKCALVYMRIAKKIVERDMPTVAMMRFVVRKRAWFRFGATPGGGGVIVGMLTGAMMSASRRGLICCSC
jgi:hypothetical protein